MEDFKVKIAQLADRVNSLKGQIQTEEATKNAFIMPFIQLLGYDVFNPLEVVPEFIADVGLKKGEKVDYAIFLNNKPVLIVECKKWKDASDAHSSQLSRYFHTLDCKFALLTNGIDFRFYSDLKKVNVMDDVPFLKFSITDIKDYQIDELQKFHKSQFSEEQILNTASRLKYESEMKSLLKMEFDSPTDAFLKHFVSQVYDGKVTAKVMADFREMFTRTTNIFLREYIKEKINMVFENNAAAKVVNDSPNIAPSNITEEVQQGAVPSEKIIDTTIEEIEAFYAVKSILRTKYDSKRVVMRDAQSYCSVLLDDNNRKPICRFWFNGKKKYLGVFNESKTEVRYEVSELDDIYKYSDELLKTPEYYNNLKVSSEDGVSDEVMN